MSWGPDLRPGDWIRTTRQVQLTITDIALGGGIPPGTRGIVNDRISGSRISVDLDTGYGTITATLDTSTCRLDRRNGGHEPFRRRAHTMTIVRLALALFLAWPFLQFTAAYLWTHHTLDGIEAPLALGLLDSLGDWFTSLITHPVPTLVYLAFLAGLSKTAFRH